MSEQSATADLGNRVMEVIAKTQRIPLESVTLDSTFEQLKIDSLDGINIPDEGVQSMRSIGETVEGVRKLVAEKTAQPEDPAV
jgi:acyl carrier protein